MPSGSWKGEGNEEDGDELDSEVRQMMGCRGLVEENTERSGKAGTAHSEAAQKKSLRRAFRYTNTPNQIQPNTELETSVERANFGQGAGGC